LTETVSRGNNQISDTNLCGGKLIHVSEVCANINLHYNDVIIDVYLHEMCLCQQSFQLKCIAYNDTLKEIHENLPEPTNNEPEIKDTYGSLLDDLNAKYERLLSLFQQLLDNTKDISADREVSHSKLYYLSASL
jgi:hypothetical protein